MSVCHYLQLEIFCQYQTLKSERPKKLVLFFDLIKLFVDLQGDCLLSNPCFRFRFTKRFEL